MFTEYVYMYILYIYICVGVLAVTSIYYRSLQHSKMFSCSPGGSDCPRHPFELSKGSSNQRGRLRV